MSCGCLHSQMIVRIFSHGPRLITCIREMYKQICDRALAEKRYARLTCRYVAVVLPSMRRSLYFKRKRNPSTHAPFTHLSVRRFVYFQVCVEEFLRAYQIPVQHIQRVQVNHALHPPCPQVFLLSPSVSSRFSSGFLRKGTPC